MNPKQIKFALFLLSGITISVIFGAIPLSTSNLSSYLPLAIAQDQQPPDIEASSMYQTHTMVIGNDIKNFVIVIPNEAHESPTQTKELRVVNQPYLPQNAVVNVGTTVTWFNADVKHPHNITLLDNNSKNVVVYESGNFKWFSASKPIKFNNTGTFTYYGPSFDKAVPNYKMNGTLTVINQPITTSFNATTTATSSPAAPNSVDTIAILMVPANVLDKVVSEIKGQGFGIDNQYPFTSLGAKGTNAGGDAQQVLLVLTSSGKNLEEVISALSNITPTMPYA